MQPPVSAPMEATACTEPQEPPWGRDEGGRESSPLGEAEGCTGECNKTYK